MKKLEKKRGFAMALSTVMMMNSLGMTMPLIAAPATVDELLKTTAKFNFGVTEEAGYTNVTQGQVYNEQDGYGFSTVEYPTEAKGWVGGVYYPRVAAKSPSNAKYIKDDSNSVQVGSKVWMETEKTGYGVYTYENTSTFDIDLVSKDYKVTVELVNPTSEVITVNLEAEDITKLTNIEVKPGERVTRSFVSSLVDGQLNLKFLASSTATAEGGATTKGVYVDKVEVEQIVREQGTKPTIFIASDSTVQTYESNFYPQTGWGQVLYNFFIGGDKVEERECEDANYSQAQTYETSSVVIENRAIGGRSSKSFIEEGKLDDLLEDVKPGDFVLVQWGHNDATASRPNRYVSPEDFEQYIRYYIDGTKQRGGTCVLVTPVARRSYDEVDGEAYFQSNFEAYRQVMLRVGEELNVPVLDLTQASIDVCNKFGAEGSKSLFLWLNPGDYPNYPAGSSDSTHLQYYGAYKFAECVAQLVQDYTVDNQLDELKRIVEIPEKFTDVPKKPTGLMPTTIGASSVSMQWHTGDDAELYYIYRAELKEGQAAEDVVFNKEDKYSVSSTPKYTDSKCEGGKTYIYTIAGFNEMGIGDFSDKITVTTKSAAYKYDFCQDTSNPTLTGWTSVHSKQKYTKEAGYGWLTAPSNGRYRANNGNTDSNDMTDDFTLGNGEFVIDLPNGEYEVKITACDLLPGTSTIKPGYTGEGLSIGGISTKQAAGTLSATVKVTDGQLNIGVGGTNPYINGLEITPILLSPTGLMYQELTFDGDKANFLLNWNDVPDAVAYKVYCKGESDNGFGLMKTITQEEKDNATTLPFVADLGETFQYYVTAVMADGKETPPSTTIEIETIDVNGVKPIAPTGLECVSADNNQIQLRWNATPTALKYVVYRSDRAEGQKGYKGYEKVAEVKDTTFIDDTVTTNVNWYYKVLAVNAAGTGELSEAAKTPITTTLTRQKAEQLTDRALVAINLSGDLGIGENVDEQGKEGTKITTANTGVFLSWRLFEADPQGTTFTLYKNGNVLASDLSITNYIDETGTANDTYQVIATSDIQLGLKAPQVATWQDHYMEFQLDKPADQVMPDGSVCTYTANDMSVGDLDGDGQYELVVKWYPSNAQDNSKAGYTGTTILDAYDIDINTGDISRMWRIDLGINIRSGAHYTQFQVWDLDGDGIAEIACKTADGTVDGKGNVIGDASKDYRNSGGYVLDGPEYFTVFSGQTGEVLDTVDYIPARGSVSAWGDAYGNRVDRFLSAIAYLDGETPSFVAARGYYTRTCLTAYSFINGKIETTWTFDSDIAGKEYEAQGNHAIAVADIDHDGKDEIIYGALVIDHDGTVKYSTGLGHGDAQHTSDWMASNEGLEIMSVHEHSNADYQVEIRDAETGEILSGFFTGKDTGRGMAADVDPTYEGAEYWSTIEWDGTQGGMYSSTSTMDNLVKISDTTPSVNFNIYWDGDLLSELQDHTFNNKNGNYYPVSSNITKWDYENNHSVTLLESAEVLTSNGTKGNLGLVADIMGDWREEIIARTNNSANDKIRIYSTTIETDYALPTFMDDSEYRLGVAWQNVGYNQPAHTSYLISEGVKAAELRVEDSQKASVSLAWTEASDGVYGHQVTGYNVYRYNEEIEDYEVIGTTSANEYTFVDQEVLPNKTYSYKVAATVNKRDSFRSQAVEATTAFDIVSVPALEAIELVQGDVNFMEYLPKAVDVIDKDGNTVEQVSITWDLTNFNIDTLGEVTIHGTIKGYNELVPLTVFVVPNAVVSIEGLEDIYTIVNVEPVLPETLNHVMKDGSIQSLPVTWDTIALDFTTLGDYEVKGTTALASEITLTIRVKENYIVSVEKLGTIEVFVGEEAQLPEQVKATFADGTVAMVDVTWESVNTSTPQLVTLKGTVEGFEKPITVDVNVIVKPLFRFDFGINANHVAEGWIGVTVNGKGGQSLAGYGYDSQKGYGFTEMDGTAIKSPIEGRAESYTFGNLLDSKVYTDFVIPDNKQFIVDVPNGKYTVEVIGGSIYKSSVKGYAEGERFSVGHAAKEYVIETLENVSVIDGQLNFTFDAGNTSRVVGIRITPEVEEENTQELILQAAEEVTAGEVVSVAVSIGKVENTVYAEDFNFAYDESIFELVGVEYIEPTIKVEEDLVHNRVLTASIDGINEGDQAIILKLKAKSVDAPQVGQIEVGAALGLIDEGNSTILDTQVSSISVTVKPAPIVEEVDKSQLLASIDTAKQLVESVQVGTKPGQYPQSAIDALKLAIQTAETVVNKEVTQAEVDAAKVALDNAITTFKTAQIKGDSEDINMDGEINVADLALVAYYFHVSSEDTALWEKAKQADVNGDSVIDIEDLTAIASKILQNKF